MSICLYEVPHSVKKDMLKYVGFCCVIGGLRAGLDKAGWASLLAVDNDPEGADLHRAAFGSCLQADVCEMALDEIPSHDVLVAGFPCQPFSSSGTRTGFKHNSGNVFEALMRIIRSRKPRFVMLENVEGLRSNRFGHTMAVVLQSLTELGYRVEWMLTNTTWFGIPQNRPRLFFLAEADANADSGKQTMDIATIAVSSDWHALFKLFGNLASALRMHFRLVSQGDISKTIRDRAPEIGKKAPMGKMLFGSAGIAVGNTYLSFEIDYVEEIAVTDLAAICCPSFRFRHEVRSVRYWGHSGETRPYMRKTRCRIALVPTSVLHRSSASLNNGYARERIPLIYDLLEYANYSRQEHGLVCFRLRPEENSFVVRFRRFGSCKCHQDSPAGITSKYRLIGNMVAPEVAKWVATSLSNSVGLLPPIRDSLLPRGDANLVLR